MPHDAMRTRLVTKYVHTRTYKTPCYWVYIKQDSFQKLIYSNSDDSFMKQLDIIVPYERLNEVNEILHKHKVGGMYFLQITGRGRAEREEVETLVGPDRYRTGKKYVPEFGSRTLVSVIIPDETRRSIIDDILSKIGTGKASDGKIFVKDVPEAYDIGTKETGDKAVL